MMLKMYAIKDRLDGFITPIPFGNDEIAIRWFLTMLDTNVDMKANPADYTLWYLGEYNKEEGEFKNDKREIHV